MTHLIAGLIGAVLGIVVALWAFKRAADDLLEMANKSEDNNRHMLLVIDYLANQVGDSDLAEKVREKLLQ